MKKTTLIKPKMYLRVTLDLPISYEEASFIKETFINAIMVVEKLHLFRKKQDLKKLHTDLILVQFESVDQIVAK